MGRDPREPEAATGGAEPRDCPDPEYPSNLSSTISSQLGQLAALKPSEAFNHSDGPDAGRAHQGKIAGVVFWVRVIAHLSITALLHGR